MTRLLPTLLRRRTSHPALIAAEVPGATGSSRTGTRTPDRPTQPRPAHAGLPLGSPGGGGRSPRRAQRSDRGPDRHRQVLHRQGDHPPGAGQRYPRPPCLPRPLPSAGERVVRLVPGDAGRHLNPRPHRHWRPPRPGAPRRSRPHRRDLRELRQTAALDVLPGGRRGRRRGPPPRRPGEGPARGGALRRAPVFRPLPEHLRAVGDRGQRGPARRLAERPAHRRHGQRPSGAP